MNVAREKCQHAGRKRCSPCCLLVAGSVAMACPGMPRLPYVARPTREELLLGVITGLTSKRGQINQATALLGKGPWGSVTNPTAGRTRTHRQAVHGTALGGRGAARTIAGTDIYDDSVQQTVVRFLFPQNQYILTWRQCSEDRHLFLTRMKLPHLVTRDTGFVWLRWAASFLSPKLLTTKNFQL